MNNIIGILIVIAVLALAIIGIRRRSKKGGCCGGGGSPVPVREKKLEGRVLGKKVVTISGMHCEHCVNNVTNAINRYRWGFRFCKPCQRRGGCFL